MKNEPVTRSCARQWHKTAGAFPVPIQVFQQQVQRGSKVYEDGHMLLLTWTNSPLSLFATLKVMEQACHAYKTEGGITIVVLSDTPKLEMEAAANSYIPPGKRLGSKFVFRQVNVPGTLRRLSLRRWGWARPNRSNRARAVMGSRLPASNANELILAWEHGIGRRRWPILLCPWQLVFRLKGRQGLPSNAACPG